MALACCSRLSTTLALQADDGDYLPEVAEEHGTGKDHGGGVGLVGTHDVLTDVSASGLEEGVFLYKLVLVHSTAIDTYTANVGTGHDTGATDKGGTNVADDVTVKVGLMG